jgi:hypothetical protein
LRPAQHFPSSPSETKAMRKGRLRETALV